jgi:hypothetical protein
MRRKRKHLLLTILIAAVLQILTSGASFFLGRHSVPHIQALDIHTKKWVDLVPTKGTKLYCFIAEGFVPCARIFQSSEEIKSLLGPGAVVIIPDPKVLDDETPTPDEGPTPKREDKKEDGKPKLESTDPGPAFRSDLMLYLWRATRAAVAGEQKISELANMLRLSQSSELWGATKKAH